MNWRAAEAFAQDVIQTYDVRCPGPGTRIRLLSGGNMQKLILGRVLEAGPRIILANQPVRGLDIGAINYVHSQLLAARDRGAAVLVISEDLDEILRALVLGGNAVALEDLHQGLDLGVVVAPVRAHVGGAGVGSPH